MNKALWLVPVFSLPVLFAWRNRAPEAAAGESAGALEALASGNERFVMGEPKHGHQTLERRSEVAMGQKPFAVIVGCADSRVPPELVFDQGLGDLFVVRCAGNVLGDAGIGSIEYAVEHLGARLVVVLAHERCGAVDAVVKGGHLPGHIAAFEPAIEPVVADAMRAGGDVLDNAVRLNAQKIAHELETCEPILSEFVHEEKLTVVAARYDLDTGEVEWLGAEAHDAPATPDAPAKSGSHH
jgi:carbonic anhydrase